ncbi:MAG TPA: hypothetical protein PKA98_09385 [Acidimicrobiales bacterium]|nr:hypothetical protein [Acidimicrobiales bacterium]
MDPTSPADVRQGRFVAASDCECIHDGPVTQPVNTMTSLAYVVAGLALARRSRRVGGDRPYAGPVAGALVLNGLGSVAYHGPGGRAGKWLHDTGLVALTATLAVAGVARVLGWEHRRAHLADAVLVAAGAAALAVRPGSELAIVAPLGVVAVGHELVRPSRHGGGRRMVGGVLLAVGAVVQARSRTGQPWCQPEGPFHGHGLWHVLSAAGLYLVADGALAERALDAG